MITNEQRAHDLAIASLNYLLSNNITSSIYLKENANGEPSIDIFEAYIDLYNNILRSMNDKFPQ